MLLEEYIYNSKWADFFTVKESQFDQKSYLIKYMIDCSVMEKYNYGIMVTSRYNRGNTIITIIFWLSDKNIAVK